MWWFDKHNVEWQALQAACRLAPLHSSKGMWRVCKQVNESSIHRNVACMHPNNACTLLCIFATERHTPPSTGLLLEIVQSRGSSSVARTDWIGFCICMCLCIITCAYTWIAIAGQNISKLAASTPLASFTEALATLTGPDSAVVAGESDGREQDREQREG